MKKLRVLLGISCLGFGSIVSANTVDLALSNDSATLDYSSTLQKTQPGDAEFNLGLLYTEDDEVVGNMGIQVIDEVGANAPGLFFGVGLKLFATFPDNFDIAALTPGITVRYSPPALDRFGVTGQLNYAPDIVSFMDADRFLAYKVTFEYGILPQASVYVGYRKMTTKINGNSETLDSTGHFGLKFSF